MHLDDPAVARQYGVARPVAPGQPGRLRIASSGAEAQLVLGAPGLAAIATRSELGRDGPLPLTTLPEQVDVTDLPADASTGGASLVLGLSADSLAPAALDVATGDGVLIVGGPRSGVATALRRCVDAHLAAVDRELVRRIELGRRSVIDADVIAQITDASTPVLVVVDDAHRVDDPGVLVDIARGEHPHVLLIAGRRADAIRTAYGHWTRELAKHQCGIVMTSRGDPDGDLLGVQLPRRTLIGARPGLGWIVDSGPLRCVQIAT